MQLSKLSALGYSNATYSDFGVLENVQKSNSNYAIPSDCEETTAKKSWRYFFGRTYIYRNP